jgi:DNA-binding XRE family transcriptional regulator
METTKLVRKFRTKQHLNQSEVAIQLGISRSTACFYESGRLNPSLAIKRKIFEISNDKNLGFSEEDIFGVQDE